MTRARDVADTQDNVGGAVAPVVSGKNICINGGMDIWARGTSFGGTTLGAYGADRWGYYRGGAAGGATWSRQNSGLTGFQYSLRAQRDSANTSTQYVGIWQGIETINSIPYAGKTVTLSFYAKCGANYSPASNGLTVVLVTGTGTDQPPYNFTGSTAAIDVNAILTTSWQRYTYTATLPSNTNEIAIQFVGYPTGTAGANDWYEITGVQLELGSQATPFSRAGGSIGGELALCQRYYFRFANGDLYQPYGTGYAASATMGIFLINHPVPMRVRPISIDYNSFYTEQFNGLGSTSGVATISNSSPFLTRINMTGLSGLTAGYTMFAYSNNNTAGFLGFSAEL